MMRVGPRIPGLRARARRRVRPVRAHPRPSAPSQGADHARLARSHCRCRSCRSYSPAAPVTTGSWSGPRTSRSPTCWARSCPSRSRDAPITAGQIDLYVEYSGTAYTAVLKHPATADSAAVLATVSREYRDRFGLAWLGAFGFNNTFAILVRRADAERYGLTRISDLGKVAPRWRAGFGYEFLERTDGFPGLARLYGLRFAAAPTALDLGLTYRALADGRVDVIAGNSTDGQIGALHLVALADDRHYFPPYEAAPVVRAALLARHPEVAAALAPLAGKISDAEMRRLNALADVAHEDIATVARDWLARNVP